MKQWYKKTWLLWLVIAGMTLIIYSGTLSYGMLHQYDDDAYLTDPSITQLSLPHVKDYFSGYYLGMYQPLPVMSFAALLRFFPGSVEAQRILNLLLHCLNILLVLVLVRRLTGDTWIGALAALFFAVHPMHVESVVWIATRSNLLYSFFFLSGLILYMNWQEKRKWWMWAFVLCCFIISLFCKVTAATFPMLLPLLDWYRKGRITWKDLVLYIPFILLSAIFILAGVKASGAFGHITGLGLEYSFTERIGILLHALWLYLYKLLVPVNLSVIYLYPWKESGTLSLSFWITGILTLALVAGLLFAGWRYRKKVPGRVLLFGLLFFLATISIVLPLKWSRTVVIAERYTYLPYIGLTVMMLVTAFHYARQSVRWTRIMLIMMSVGLAGIYSWQSYAYSRAWKDPLTLFSNTIKTGQGKPEVSMGYYNRANEYLRLKMTDPAIADYSEALRIFPFYRDACYNRGLAYFSKGEYGPAVSDFTCAIEQKGDFWDAWLNRGIAYRAMGQYQPALSDFNHVIAENPYGMAYYNRGVLYYFNLGDRGKGCDDWSEAYRMGFVPAGDMLEKFCGAGAGNSR